VVLLMAKLLLEGCTLDAFTFSVEPAVELLDELLLPLTMSYSCR